MKKLFYFWSIIINKSIKQNKMETTIKNLEKARKEVANKQIDLLEQGISFFSLTLQDLQDTEEKLKKAIDTLKCVNVTMKALNLK